MSHVPNWGRASSKALRWKHAWRVQGTKGRSVVWNAEDEGIREVRKVTRGDRLGRIHYYYHHYYHYHHHHYYYYYCYVRIPLLFRV